MATRTLAECLGHYLARSLYNPAQLAELAGVPRRTVANWLAGSVARPRTWHDLLRVARSLGLGEAEANEVLRAAGFGPLASLRVEAGDMDGLQLIAHWIPGAPLQPIEALAPADAAPLLRSYLVALAAEMARLPAYYPPQVPFTLDRIAQQTYVRAVTPLAPQLADLFMEMRPLPWAQAAPRLARAVVIGHGGIGKTHLLRQEAVSAAQNALSAWPLHPRAEVPLLVRLADLAPLLPGHPRPADTLEATARAAALQVPALVAGSAQRLLAALLTQPTYPLLLLLDGWDEVDGALSMRLTLALTHLRSLPAARIVLTSRPEAGYEQAAAALLAEAVVEVQPLATVQVQRFVRSWFFGRRDLEWSLRAVLRDSPELAHLAATPLMLTMLAILAELGQIATADKMELYNRLLRLVLEGRWRVHNLQLPETRVHAKLRLLQNIAWRLATHAGTWHNQLPVAEIEQFIAQLPAADRLKATWFDSWGGSYGGVLWELTAWDNLLCIESAGDQTGEETPGKGAGRKDIAAAPQIGFLHQAFQAYLVASYLLARFEEESQDALEVHHLQTGKVEQSEWLHVLRLLVAHARAYPERAAGALLATLLLPSVRAAHALPNHLVVIMAELQAAAVDLPELAPATATLLDRLLQAVQEPQTELRVRVYSGRLLGQLGDPRPALRDVDALDLVEIPAGAFTLGGDQPGAGEPDVADLPRQTVHLPAFWIGRYLVTNAQYAQFMQEGYEDPFFWLEARALGLWRAGEVLRAEPSPAPNGHLLFRSVWTRTPHAMHWPFDLPNHPAQGVNWFEARAFMRWLDARRRAAGTVPAGYHLDLPSEVQWEKAARGPDGRVYPWGNDFAPDRLNWSGQMLHSPTATGSFPRGASPYGVLDMAGNMMEWTRTVYTPGSPYDLDGQPPPSAETPVVIRGGAYYSPADSCRCAFRSTAAAIGRLTCGFRVALVPD